MRATPRKSKSSFQLPKSPQRITADKLLEIDRVDFHTHDLAANEFGADHASLLVAAPSDLGLEAGNEVGIDMSTVVTMDSVQNTHSGSVSFAVASASIRAMALI